MRVLYFDLISGISGDMVISSLLSLGIPFNAWKKEVARLKLPLRLELKRVERGHIKSHLLVIEGEGKGVKRPQEFLEIIKATELKKDIKEKAEAILRRILKAEAKVHGEGISKIRLRELAGYDTVLDVVGSLVAIDILGVEEIYSSPVPLGNFKAPVTLELLKNIPVYEKNTDFEITTPTGAAIIVSLASQFIPLPRMKIQKIGYGAGSADLESPNLLRAIIGVLVGPGKEEKPVLMVETNIDNMAPEIFGHLMERLFAKGALDVYFTPIYAKKNRPAVILSAIVREDRKETIIDTIFEETKTLGVRVYPVERYEAEREIKEVKTEYGRVQVKIGRWKGKIKNISFEYEDMKRIANKKNIPLKILYERMSRHLRDFP